MELKWEYTANEAWCMIPHAYYEQPQGEVLERIREAAADAFQRAGERGEAPSPGAYETEFDESFALIRLGFKVAEHPGGRWWIGCLVDEGFADNIFGYVKCRDREDLKEFAGGALKDYLSNCPPECLLPGFPQGETPDLRKEYPEVLPVTPRDLQRMEEAHGVHLSKPLDALLKDRRAYRMRRFPIEVPPRLYEKLRRMDPQRLVQIITAAVDQPGEH